MTPDAVIVAAGSFPRKTSPAGRILAAARRVVCCDGAADTYVRRTGRMPDLVVGDFDSVRHPERFPAIQRIDEQDTNDLDKAIRTCRLRGWQNLAIVAATGRREDHSVGNLFRALDAHVPVVTDTGTFYPVRDRATFCVPCGTAVSVFAPDSKTRMTSEGLVWPLSGVRFDNLYVATLNKTCAESFSVSTTHPVLVFYAYRPVEPDGRIMV